MVKLSNGSAKRHRRVLRDNIQGITSKAIHRLCTEIAGVPSLCPTIYEELRSVLKCFLENNLRTAITWTEHRRSKTVTVDDIKRGLRQLPPQSCPRGYTTLCPDNAQSPAHWAAIRTAVCKEWKDKDSGKFLIDHQLIKQVFHHCTDAPAPPMRGGPSFGVLQMKRLTAEIGQDYKTDLRWGTDSVTILQQAAEAYLVGLVSEGYAYAIESDRCMLEPRDIKKVRDARAIWIPPIADSRGSSTVDVQQLVELSTHRGLVKAAADDLCRKTQAVSSTTSNLQRHEAAILRATQAADKARIDLAKLTEDVNTATAELETREAKLKALEASNRK